MPKRGLKWVREKTRRERWKFGTVSLRSVKTSGVLFSRQALLLVSVSQPDARIGMETDRERERIKHAKIAWEGNRGATACVFCAGDFREKRRS